MTPLVTFDFHNTIAYCDPWFYLEIRDLPVHTLEILRPDVFTRHSREEIATTYRDLRKSVMASGKEIDAVEGVLQVSGIFEFNLPRDEVETTIAGLMRNVLEHATPVTGAIESIRAIAANGIAVGVVSSAVYHPFLEWTLARFGIAEDLTFVLTSASSGYYKSDPEIYRTAIRAVNGTPARSIHVGDSERWDVWSAQQAGMRAVWFQNGNVDTLVDRPLETAPDHVVASMADVAPWVLANLDMAR